MFRNCVFLLIILSVYFISCNESEESEDFIPTKEWQVVKKGQRIPKGLHVRMNLETGLTEAKLMDEQEDKNKALSAPPQESNPSESTEQPPPNPTIQEAMKNIKGDDILNPDEIKHIKDKFRSYEEIKKSLGDLNLTPKIDSEVIADLLKRHKELVEGDDFDKAEVLRIIEDLDFLAHQYDNAREFVNQNGFHEIVYKNINSSDSEIKRETLKLMGSLMQNNVAPKIHALESGAIAVLLRLIKFEPDFGVKTRALSALGALLRSFPVAQQKFIENGGLTVLSNFFDGDDIKFQLKLVTIVSDLIIEHHWASIDHKLNQYYTNFDLTKHVLEHNWCDNLNKFLYRLLIMDKDDHDSIEKCLTAMHSLRVNCGHKFEKKLLTSLQKRYEELANDKDNNNISSEDFNDSVFFNVLKNLCDEILHYVYKNSIKTEL